MRAVRPERAFGGQRRLVVLVNQTAEAIPAPNADGGRDPARRHSDIDTVPYGGSGWEPARSGGTGRSCAAWLPAVSGSGGRVLWACGPARCPPGPPGPCAADLGTTSSTGNAALEVSGRPAESAALRWRSSGAASCRDTVTDAFVARSSQPCQ